MPLAVDVFWSFRSPYSYLATPRLVRLAAEYDVDVNVRAVLPIAVRIPGFFDTVNPLWPPCCVTRRESRSTSASRTPGHVPTRSCRSSRRAGSRRSNPTSID
jgi:hypothetical protein